jgi:hypothetical protein
MEAAIACSALPEGDELNHKRPLRELSPLDLNPVPSQIKYFAHLVGGPKGVQTSDSHVCAVTAGGNNTVCLVHTQR